MVNANFRFWHLKLDLLFLWSVYYCGTGIYSYTCGIEDAQQGYINKKQGCTAGILNISISVSSDRSAQSMFLTEN